MGEKLLLVDDDPDIGTLMKEELERAGYEVRLCDAGDEVIGVMLSYKPALLIMDVMLPGVDGYSLTNTIAEDPELSKIPIVIMSALSTSRAMFENLPQVAAFFSKPFSTEEFLETIKTTLAKKE